MHSTSRRIPARRLVQHLRGNAVAYLALFLALGGSAYAAGTYVVNSNADVAPGVIAGSRGPAGSNNNIIAGSLGGADVADGAVGRAQLAPDAVDSARIADGSVKAADLAPGAVTTDRIANASVTASKLGTDVQRRIDFSTSLQTGAGWSPNTYDVSLTSRLHFKAVCGNDGTGGVTQFQFNNTDTTETPTQSIDLLVTDASHPSPAPQLYTQGLAAGHPVLFTYANSSGRALATIRYGSETVTATFSWQLTASACSFQGELQRFTA